MSFECIGGKARLSTHYKTENVDNLFFIKKAILNFRWMDVDCSNFGQKLNVFSSNDKRKRL